MGFGSSSMTGDIQQGVDSINNYYNQAAAYENPYTQNAGQDFGAGRNALYSASRMQGSNPHYNQQMYSQYLNETPDQLFSQAMSGYTQSPFEQDEMKYAMSGLSNQMAASGQLGSGRDYTMGAEIGNAIGSQDISKYLHGEQEAFKDQQGILKNFDQETMSLVKLFQDMIGTESGASKDMAENAMRAGQETSNLYRTEATQSKNYRPGHEAMGLLGAGMGMAGNIMNSQAFHDALKAGAIVAM